MQAHVDLCKNPITGGGYRESFAARWETSCDATGTCTGSIDEAPNSGTTLYNGAAVSDCSVADRDAGTCVCSAGLCLGTTGGSATVGPYATLNGNGFASRSGGYTMSVWATKNVCDARASTLGGQTEFTVLSQDGVGDGSGSFIRVAIICDTAQSTLRAAVLRLTMNDVAGRRAEIDVPLANAAVRSGGVITDTWVHFAWVVESQEDSDGNDIGSLVNFFVDGTAVPGSSLGLPAENMTPADADGMNGNLAAGARGAVDGMLSHAFGDFSMDH